MSEWFARTLAREAGRRRPLAVRLAFILAGALVFLGLIPAGLIWLGDWLGRYLVIGWPRGLEIMVGFNAVLVGLAFVGASAWVQWTLGQGTPHPLVATQRLVVKGPYQLCRNPIQLGLTLYYLGLGAYLGNLTTGLLAALLATAAGVLYHKLVEEKELLMRFGEEYEQYRRSTPFLIPRLWR